MTFKQILSTKSWQPDRSIQTPANVSYVNGQILVFTCHHMFTINIIIHLCRTSEENITWPEMSQDSFLVNMCHVARQPWSHRRCLVKEVVKIKTWLKMWILKLWLNLGPIISAPAAKGNFSTTPHNSHHFWGLGLWRHTRGILLLKSDRVSGSFVPF